VVRRRAWTAHHTPRQMVAGWIPLNETDTVASAHALSLTVAIVSFDECHGAVAPHLTPMPASSERTRAR
jgi:hypothetical protein